MSNKLYLYIGFFFLGTKILFSQMTDSLDIIKQDSAKVEQGRNFYENLKQSLKKSKWTRNLASLFSDTSQPTSSKQIQKELNLDYKSYQGKVVRNIEIVTLDPFGFDEKDLTRKPQKKIEIYGNALHNKTKSRTIRKQLLFKENDSMDSLLLKESERVLRGQTYIRRVLIRPVEISAVSDSVDIQVAVLDSWTMLFASDLTDKRGWTRVSEHNLFGLGHEAYVLYRQYFSGFSDNGKGFGYRAKNLWNSQTDIFTSYYVDYENLYTKQLAAERPFYTSYTRWSGRISYYESRYKDDIYFRDSMYHPPIQSKIFDAYGGYLIPIHKDNGKAINNFIISARYRNIDYREIPTDYFGTDDYYTDEKLFLAKISLNSTDFLQDRYIFKHGDIEDVSVGHSVFLTSGALQKNESLSPYFGLGFSTANYRRRGYHSLNFEIGSLFMKDNVRQSVIRGETVYFSNLFSWSNWYFRQFLRTSFVMGINRIDHPKDRVSLRGVDGILGFDSNVYGTRKLVLSTQTQAYSPFYWLGFRFNPFFNVDVGFLGKENDAFLKTDVYSKVAIGFYISNDFLMFRNIQFSFCYFPRIPEDGNHIFKITNIQNDDFRLQNFQYRPPNMVIYR